MLNIKLYTIGHTYEPDFNTKDRVPIKYNPRIETIRYINRFRKEEGVQRYDTLIITIGTLQDLFTIFLDGYMLIQDFRHNPYYREDLDNKFDFKVELDHDCL